MFCPTGSPNPFFAKGCNFKHHGFTIHRIFQNVSSVNSDGLLHFILRNINNNIMLWIWHLISGYSTRCERTYIFKYDLFSKYNCHTHTIYTIMLMLFRSLREIINWTNVLHNAWWDGKTHLEVVPWDTWLGVGLVGWEEWLTVFEHRGIP